MDKADITATLVSRLVAEQFPAWAHLPVAPVALDGWDNATYRLGEEMSVRLPSAEVYAAQLEKEHRWLPILASGLPLHIPEPLATGEPGCGCPQSWSVYRWLEGTHATVERVADLGEFATESADFLAALHRIDPGGGPLPGVHNFFRGGPLRTYDPETRAALATLVDEIDTRAATEVWDAALRSTWVRPPVWVHGDVTASNLLVVHGRLSAVLDFGCLGVGDPACDLTIAWTFLLDESRERFRARLSLDEATWARGRGWALWKALITLSQGLETGTDHAEVASARFGWRIGARHVIHDVLAEHRGMA